MSRDPTHEAHIEATVKLKRKCSVCSRRVPSCIPICGLCSSVVCALHKWVENHECVDMSVSLANHQKQLAKKLVACSPPKVQKF